MQACLREFGSNKLADSNYLCELAMMKGDVQLELCSMISGFHHILMKRAIESSMHFNQWAK